MANYANLKAAISQAIKTNGNQEITGQVLQNVLNSIVSVIGANYTFAGVATPATNPGTPDQNVVYLAMEGGTYTNFNAMVLSAGISLLMWNGTWTSETVMCGDGGVFDISVYKSSGGTLATFADLAAALDGGNNIPASARKGGMSVKFVQSSDNKYVQYRCVANEFTTDTNKWAICDEGVYIANPEWVKVVTDSEKKILYGVKTDGKFYFGDGCPPQVKDYISTYGYNKDAVNALLASKVDKVTGKSLIDANVASSVYTEESVEYIEVVTDKDSRVLGGRKADGTVVENVGIETKAVQAETASTEVIEVNDHIELSENAKAQLREDISYNSLSSVIMYAYAEGATADDDTHFYGWKNGKCAIQRAIDAADGITPTKIYVRGILRITEAEQFTLQANDLYNVIFLPATKSNIELIGESEEKTIIDADMPDSFADYVMNHQIMDISGNNCYVRNMSIYAKNVRYCMHTDQTANNRYSMNGFKQGYYNVTFRHYPNITNAFETPFGALPASGGTLIAENCSIICDAPNIRPLGAAHDHMNYNEASTQIFRNCKILNTTPTNTPGAVHVLTLEPYGSGVHNNFILENNNICGCVPLIVCKCSNYSTKSDLSKFEADIHFNVTGYNEAPYGYTTQDSSTSRVLRITSKSTGANSSVRFDKTSSAFDILIKGLSVYDTTDIYGVVHKDGYHYRDGVVGLSGYAMGELALDINTIASIQKRLGDCSGTSKSLVVIVDGTSYTITFNQDYTNYSDEDMLAVFTSVIGSVANVELYCWGKDYFPEFQPSFTIQKNNTQEVILRGMGVKITGDGLHKATSDEEVDAITLDDVIPGYQGRCCKKVMLSIYESDRHHIALETYPQTVGDRYTSAFAADFGIGTTPGVFKKKEGGILKFKYYGYLILDNNV